MSRRAPTRRASIDGRPDTDEVAPAPTRLTSLRDALVQVLTDGTDDGRPDIWLVGGLVRDALLDRPLLDVDLAVLGEAEPVARRLARASGGTAFPLGDDHGCWRVTASADATDRERLAPPLRPVLQFDVCSLRGDTIEADLRARDFTANAIAVPLAKASAPIRLIDPTGGIADLEHGTLRMVATSSFDDDPLRMLRAARIAHTLEWQIDPATTDAIRDRAHRAEEPAGERTFHELRLLLLHPGARRGWRLLDALGLVDVLVPELAPCRGLAQSRFHHLDVYDHTLAVLDNCEDLLDATEFWLPLPADSGLEMEPFSDAQRLAVLLAALCHDIAKPATRVVLDGGRVGFGGHDEVGMGMVDTIAERWCWSGALRRDVRRLVGTHLALGFLLHTPAGPRERHRFLRRVEPVAAEAIVLSVGDRFATSGLDDRRRWVRAHLQLARHLWTDHWREQRDGRPQPLLDGMELAAAAGIQPGPQLGELVTALAEEQAIGAVRTRGEAEAFAREFELSGSRCPAP